MLNVVGDDGGDSDNEENGEDVGCGEGEDDEDGGDHFDMRSRIEARMMRKMGQRKKTARITIAAVSMGGSLG